MEVMNILKKNAYQVTDKEKVPVIKKWLGLRGLQLIKAFTNEEQEECKTTKDSIQY